MIFPLKAPEVEGIGPRDERDEYGGNIMARILELIFYGFGDGKIVPPKS